MPGPPVVDHTAPYEHHRREVSDRRLVWRPHHFVEAQRKLPRGGTETPQPLCSASGKG